MASVTRMIPRSYLRLEDGQASPKGEGSATLASDGHRNGTPGMRQIVYPQDGASPVPSMPLPQTQDEWVAHFAAARCPDCAIMRGRLVLAWWIVADLVAVILIAWAIHAGVIQ